MLSRRKQAADNVVAGADSEIGGGGGGSELWLIFFLAKFVRTENAKKTKENCVNCPKIRNFRKEEKSVKTEKIDCAPHCKMLQLCELAPVAKENLRFKAVNNLTT